MVIAVFCSIDFIYIIKYLLILKPSSSRLPGSANRYRRHDHTEDEEADAGSPQRWPGDHQPAAARGDDGSAARGEDGSAARGDDDAAAARGDDDAAAHGEDGSAARGFRRPAKGRGTRAFGGPGYL